VPDLPVRLGLYRRISGLSSDAETEAMEAELIDRFGALPEEVKNLLDVVDLKRLCRRSGVEKVEAGPKGMVLQFRNNSFHDPAGLVQWMAGWKDGAVRLRPDHKLAVVRELTNVQRVGLARKVLGSLAKIREKALA
jgi:transcription-repair coupling factor (superfamily II helicase)